MENNFINGFITYYQLIKAYIFNDELVNHKKGLRPYEKTGEEHSRDPQDISAENLEGKIAEYAVYNVLTANSVKCSTPSIDAYGRGKSNNGYGLVENNTTIDVKSSKTNARSMILPVTKFKWDRQTNHVSYADNETDVLPDVFIMVNVGINGLSPTQRSYKKYFVKRIFSLCKNLTRTNGFSVVKDMNIQIKGILLKKDIVYAIKHRLGYCYGTYNVKNKKDAAYIPFTNSEYQLKYTNYVFPYFDRQQDNPRNHNRIHYLHMYPPTDYLKSVTNRSNP